MKMYIEYYENGKIKYVNISGMFVMFSGKLRIFEDDEKNKNSDSEIDYKN